VASTRPLFSRYLSDVGDLVKREVERDREHGE